MTCRGCIQVRRAVINKLPSPIRTPLARVFLPVATSADVVREARRWVHVPFRHQGRDRRGVDCAGLPIGVLQALGALPDDFEPPDYPRFPQQGYLEQFLNRYCTALREPVPGCLVAIRWQITLAHTAIYTDTDTLIHALEKHGAVIEHGFRGMWRSRFAAGFWALPGVRYG